MKCKALSSNLAQVQEFPEEDNKQYAREESQPDFNENYIVQVSQEISNGRIAEKLSKELYLQDEKAEFCELWLNWTNFWQIK